MLATYFGALGDNLDTALSLPVAGLHLDLVRAPEQLATVLATAPQDLRAVARRRSTAATSGAPICRRCSIGSSRSSPSAARDHVQIAPSCSLLHVPIDLAAGDASSMPS